jgi:hypothetical protein
LKMASCKQRQGRAVRLQKSTILSDVLASVVALTGSVKRIGYKCANDLPGEGDCGGGKELRSHDRGSFVFARRSLHLRHSEVVLAKRASKGWRPALILRGSALPHRAPQDEERGCAATSSPRNRPLLNRHVVRQICAAQRTAFSARLAADA